ncbi:MAG: biopolymer transporter ExbD [Porphyromonadaceae bacterium]|nr:biopolymer transporter ExbD [Porphyromonadaceae bacterium]
MPKVNVKRKSTAIDMTAMSDVTVLLLTFFMLTSTFIEPEPVQISAPSSVSEIKIPEANVLDILVEKNGRIFMGIDGPAIRVAMLQDMAEEYGYEFTDQELANFQASDYFGVPISQMKALLDMPFDKQTEVMVNQGTGIPIDTTSNASNEFKSWVKAARKANRDVRIAIKAAYDTPYSEIHKIMTSLQDIRENRYNLITTLKSVSGDF